MNTFLPLPGSQMELIWPLAPAHPMSRYSYDRLEIKIFRKNGVSVEIPSQKVGGVGKIMQPKKASSPEGT